MALQNLDALQRWGETWTRVAPLEAGLAVQLDKIDALESQGGELLRDIRRLRHQLAMVRV